MTLSLLLAYAIIIIVVSGLISALLLTCSEKRVNDPSWMCITFFFSLAITGIMVIVKMLEWAIGVISA